MKNGVSVKQSLWLKDNGYNKETEYVYVNGLPITRKISDINLVSQNIQSYSYIPQLGEAVDYVFSKFDLKTVPLVDIIGEPELPHYYLSSAVSYVLDKCIEYVDKTKK